MTRKINCLTKLWHLLHWRYASDRCRIYKLEDVNLLRTWVCLKRVARHELG